MKLQTDKQSLTTKEYRFARSAKIVPIDEADASSQRNLLPAPARLVIMRAYSFRPVLIICFTSVFAMVMLWAPHAQSQSDQALDAARGKFQHGVELEQAKNWTGALKSFREVGQVKMTAQVRYHIANCEEHLGQLVAALGGYELALALSEGMHPDFISDVQASIAELNSRIPKLAIERGTGAEAAVVELDGIQLGAASIGVETPLDPGPHTLTASAPDFTPYHQTILVEEGVVKLISINLLPLVTEQTIHRPSSASDSTLDAPPLLSKKKFGVAPYVLAGTGLAVATLGTTLLVIASNKQNSAEKLCGGDLDCRGEDKDDQKEAKRQSESASKFETFGFIGLGVGIAGVVMGTVLFILEDRTKAETSSPLSLVPKAPNAEAGFTMQLAF